MLICFFLISLLIAVQQVESFPLTLSTRSSQILLEAKDSNCLVLAADQELRVYSLKGALLASFKDHTMPISSIYVVSWFLMCKTMKEIFLHLLIIIPSVSRAVDSGYNGFPFVFASAGQLPRCDGISGPLLTSADMENRQRPQADPGEPVPLTGRLTHNVQVALGFIF